MPTYEYACVQCGQRVEVFQRITEEPLAVCGVCGGPLRKVFHPAGIVFKGSGFYATDSRSSPKTSSSKSSAAPSEGSAASSGDGSGSSSSDGSGSSAPSTPSDGAGGGKDRKEKSA